MEFSTDLFRQRIVDRLSLPFRVQSRYRRHAGGSGWDRQKVTDFLKKELDSGSAPVERVVILGSGGHAKVIIEIMEESGDVEIVGCVGKHQAGGVLGYPVLGDDGVLPQLLAGGIGAVFVAIGDNRRRRELSLQLRESGFRLVNAISQGAWLSPRATLGQGVVINAAARLGDGAIVNTGATIDHDCQIGNWAHVAPGVHLAGCVTVGEGAFLGVGSKVIPSVAVGDWAVVGAGAAVIRNIPNGAKAVGVPAREIARKG
jgi:UDP-perosamine 4-acetyltransferase